jgi:hypothetical protein
VTGVCKFCGCTEERPCFIPLARDRFEGMGGVAFPGVPLLGEVQPCAWLLEDVCDAPACVEKAYLEARPLAERLMLALELEAAA